MLSEMYVLLCWDEYSEDNCEVHLKCDVMKFWCFFVYVFFSRWPLNLSILRESEVVASSAIVGLVLICVFNSDPIVAMKFCALEFGA